MFSFGFQANQLAISLLPCITVLWPQRSPPARPQPNALPTALFTAATENSGNSDPTNCSFNKSNHPIFNALDCRAGSFLFRRANKNLHQRLLTLQYNSTALSGPVVYQLDRT
jgi:hypothetical protein